jgi:hypothetical protein
MRAGSGTLVVTLVVLGTVALGVFARAEDPANKAAKRTGATRVNIVKSVPLEVTVSNAPLGVVAELPPVDIATLPAVTVSALPTATHVGQAVNDHVVLNLVNPMTSPIFVRCNDDGTRDVTEFAVPAGSKLVVTDVDWVITASQLVQFATLRLFVENKATPANRCLTFLQTGPTTNVETGGGTYAPGFGTTGILSGFVVGSGARIVADLRTPAEAVSSGTSLAAFATTNATVVVRGYLVKAP